MVKKGAVIALASVGGIGASIFMYYYWKKSKERVVTLSLDKSTVRMCYESFIASGTVVDGFGRPVAGCPVYLWANGQRSEKPFLTDASGTFRVEVCFITYREGQTPVHIPYAGSDRVTLKAEAEGYFSPEATITVTYQGCEECSDCPIPPPA